MRNVLRATSMTLLGLTLGSCGAAEIPDLILTNGHVVTVDVNLPEAQAVAIGGDRILAVGSRLTELDDTRSLEEALAIVARRVERLEPGEWLTGSGWHTGNWGVEEWPTAAALDRVAPDNPVALVGMHSHASWLNSKALEAAGITRDLQALLRRRGRYGARGEGRP